MNSLDYEVLQRASDWLQQGRGVHLFTVVQTWGSAPRLPGALLAMRDDGHLVGSVSGGCIEDDLADKAKHGELPQTVSLMEYGVSRDEAQRFGIPCGGRLLIFVEASVDNGLQWVVFEPNSELLCARVRRAIANFLTTVWRNGALEGTTVEQAFFVKCDRTTMTRDDIDNGRLICVIGIAPVKPAEFVIIRIGLWTADAQQ